MFEQIFINIVNQAIEKKLVGGNEFFTDSTHIKANANKKKFKVEVTTKIKKRKLDLEKEINEEEKINEEVNQEEEKKEDKKEEEPKQEEPKPEENSEKEEDKKEVLNSLQELGAFNLDKEDKVGASIGDDLKKSAIYSLGIGAILIVLYITLRFEFSFAIGGILSLLHDIIIAVGFIALMGYEVDTPFIAAILTILGYSINDTIVIYDRIRENLKRRHTKNWTLEDCMDESVNQTAIRSLNTSITTLFSVIALLIFGGASLKTFIMTLLIGILAGTYSSIFIATPIVYILNKRKGNNMEDMFKDDDENNDGKRVEKILV